MKKHLLVLIVLFSVISVSANEPIRSYLDVYYDALALQGQVERPYLNYRSFSTARWDTAATIPGPWKGRINPKTDLLADESRSLEVEDLSLYQSFNSAMPYGMNDGGLWQGKGYNLDATAGISFFSPHFEASFNPHFYFSQNADYDTRTADSWSGSEYGYYNSGIDLPQRFGDDAYLYAGWGQSQLRTRYNNWSLGVGTENVWIGPATQTAFIWSNNADGYPHIDIGLDRTTTRWGDLEAKMWWGVLMSSSEIERVEPDSIQSFLNGLSLSYAPAAIPGLTLGLHGTSQIAIEELDAGTFFLFLNPEALTEGSNSNVNPDSRASVTANWLFDEVGFEVYGEYAKEDYSTNLRQYLLDPGHADAFVLGFKQIIPSGDSDASFLLVNGEVATNKWSQDYYINGLGWGGGFYRHGHTNIGYANQGQVLGAGMGTGANLQHLAVSYYAPFGYAGLFGTRHSLDDSEVYIPSNFDSYSQMNLPVVLSIGGRGRLFLNHGWSLGGELAYVHHYNWDLESGNDFPGLHLNLMLNYRY